MERFIQIQEQGDCVRVLIKGAYALNLLREQLRTRFNRLLLDPDKPIVVDLSDAWWDAESWLAEIDAFFYRCTEVGRSCTIQGLERQPRP